MKTVDQTRLSDLCVCVSLTLHGLDEGLDGVWSDAESGTFLHEDRRDVAVHVQVVHRLRLQAQRVHELSAGGDESSQLIVAFHYSELPLSVQCSQHGTTIKVQKS